MQKRKENEIKKLKKKERKKKKKHVSLALSVLLCKEGEDVEQRERPAERSMSSTEAVDVRYENYVKALG